MNNLKKIFYGVSFLILVVMTLIYSVLTRGVETFEGGYKTIVTAGVMNAAGFTGLPAISVVLLIPSFVFGILSLCLNNKVISFIRDLFGFFASAFSIASAIVSFFFIAGAYYIPIILCVCATILFVISLISLIAAIKVSGKEEGEQSAGQSASETLYDD